MTSVATTTKNTWCPGCPNHMILAGVKRFLEDEINSGKSRDDFAIVSGIGCHAKIFDYLNINGLNSLHGRVLPTCLGLKVGNPNLNVIGFSGDGDAYAEGMAHTVHAARYNVDMTYLVHNNQVFALTLGEPTPTTQIGFKDKTTPFGVNLYPLNPLKLMLAAGATFVARVFADVNQVTEILKEAQKHKGFSFVEIIQPCIVFHPDVGYKEKVYPLESSHDETSFEEAWRKADEFDYNSPIRIPIGIFYQKESESFEDKFAILKKFKEDKTSWKDINR